MKILYEDSQSWKYSQLNKQCHNWLVEFVQRDCQDMACHFDLLRIFIIETWMCVFVKLAFHYEFFRTALTFTYFWPSYMVQTQYAYENCASKRDKVAFTALTMSEIEEKWIDGVAVFVVVVNKLVVE